MLSPLPDGGFSCLRTDTLAEGAGAFRLLNPAAEMLAFRPGPYSSANEEASGPAAHLEPN